MLWDVFRYDTWMRAVLEEREYAKKLAAIKHVSIEDIEIDFRIGLHLNAHLTDAGRKMHFSSYPHKIGRVTCTSSDKSDGDFVTVVPTNEIS